MHAIETHPTMQAAQTYIKRGWKIFPLKPGLKTPATSSGFKDATTDLDQISQWFDNGVHNLGIATGHGLAVLDIDRKGGKDGLTVIRHLEAIHGALPDTYKVSTPSGGEHWFYAYPPEFTIQSKANLFKEHGEGLDIRADGGYVVAAPSQTNSSADATGKTHTGHYTVSHRVPVAALPDAWLKVLIPRERVSVPRAQPIAVNDQLSEVQDALLHIPNDDYDLWVSIGKACYSLGNEGFMLWDTWSRSSQKYNQAEMPSKWQSFSAGAQYQAAFIFDTAARYGWANPRKFKFVETSIPKNTSFEDYSTAPTDPIKEAIASLSQDAGAVFEPDVLAALAALDMVDYARYRQEVKRSKLVVMRDFDEAVKAQRPQGSSGYDDHSIAAQIVEFVQSRSTLFMDADKEAYARIRVAEHWETWLLESSGFKEWLAAELYRETSILPKSEPIKDAILALAGIAKYGSAPQAIEQKPVFLRSGMTPQGYAIDLCNDAWQAVLIEAGSWQIDNQQTVAFKRTKTMQALPVPLAKGAGNVDDLFQLINCPEESRNMLLAWMLECWRTDTAYPVAEIGNTEQGSGKSRAQSTLKRFIDPSAVNLRGKPKAVEDIYIAACNSLLISYENLSHLTDEMQDAFCVLATGGGFAKRQLFKDAEESTLSAKRPVIMNGIGTLATRQDLVDRLINLELNPLKPSERKTDSELDALLAAKEASIFTGLLDLFAQALALLPSIEIEQKARMADFCLLGAAVYAARGVQNPTTAFMQDYKHMRREAIYRTLDSSPVASAVMAYLDKNPLGAEFTTAKNALDVLVQSHTDGEAWPRSAKGFTEAIKRLSPAFRQIGIKVEVGKQRNKNGYPVIIKYLEPFKAVVPDHLNKIIHPSAFQSSAPKVVATA